MIAIRNDLGEFVGVFDGQAERRLPCLRLPVRREIDARWPVSPSSRITADIIDLAWAQWQTEDRRLEWVLRAAPDAERVLDRAAHVYVRGATCETWLGRQLTYRETVQRIVWLLILHRMPAHGTIH